jgi:hypothetical protein
MRYTAEQHLQMAKLLRQKAMGLPAEQSMSAIKQSNLFLTLAAAAAEDRGGLDFRSFDFDAVPPDWSEIDRQVANLTSIKVDNRAAELAKCNRELWERIRRVQGPRQAETMSSRLSGWWSRFSQR